MARDEEFRVDTFPTGTPSSQCKSDRGNKKKERKKMKGWAKKIGLILGIVASVLIIGQTVSGWVGDKTEDKTDTEASIVAVVE